MEKYIKDWLEIIDGMNNDNTYKLAWGRAILECIVNDKYREYDNNHFSISFHDIAEKMLKYYWNQTFFFNLKQGPYKDREVVIVKIVKKMIDRYIELKDNFPIRFNEAELFLKKKDSSFYYKSIEKCSCVLHENVSFRFLHVEHEAKSIYLYDKLQFGSMILIEKKYIGLLKDYAIVLSQLLNFKWAQLLEKFNFAPKISNKVNGLSEAKLKRRSLTIFKNELLKQFEDGKIIDFYTGEELSEKDVSIDHVIPWSFMYSDDIRNLVVTSKKANSRKSNKLPSLNQIEKLKERNTKLINLVSDRYKNDLLVANENGFVDKYYYDFRL